MVLDFSASRLSAADLEDHKGLGFRVQGLEFRVIEAQGSEARKRFIAYQLQARKQSVVNLGPTCATLPRHPAAWPTAM